MTWFNRPYPLLEKNQTKFIVILGFGLFIPFFLYVYQPFGIAKVVEQYKVLYVSGIGLHISFVLALNYFVIPKLFPKVFNPERWTIWKEILYILSSFFLATCSNFVYNNTVGKDISEYNTFLEFLGITFAVGIFPVMIMVFWMERNLTSRNVSKATEYSKLLSRGNHSKEEASVINIQSESTKANDLEVPLRDFVFATSDNNYSTIFFEKDGEMQRRLLRLSFKNLENQVAEYAQIIRCHKSYIVNRERILEVKGNARSLMLQVDLYEEMIPVSRSFPKENLM